MRDIIASIPNADQIAFSARRLAHRWEKADDADRQQIVEDIFTFGYDDLQRSLLMGTMVKAISDPVARDAALTALIQRRMDVQYAQWDAEEAADAAE